MNNRITDHRSVRACDLIPHELNPRTHSAAQREALNDLIGEVGYARSTLAYIADRHKHLGSAAPLTLIDGHLRREEMGAQEITVEILDVDDQEARKLLLSIDPMAILAGYKEETLNRLRQSVTTSSPTLTGLWEGIADAQAAAQRVLDRAKAEAKARPTPPDRYLIFITCRSEAHQREVLTWAKEEEYKAKAVIT